MLNSAVLAKAPIRGPHPPRQVTARADDSLLARAHMHVGAVLRGKYRLDRVLGVGGMGCVYAATHLHNADRVAVKILHRELSADADLRARFLREGDAANRVGHPGTVRVFDDDVAEDGSVFIVMDLLDGETLHARLARRGGKLEAREVVSLVCQVLDVLGAAHDKGIVHRDLKPENLFLTRDGQVKVLDFGLARLRDGAATPTARRQLFGTPAFMAPEQALGKTSEVDALSDLWAVGATAFTLLTGRLVHQANTVEQILFLSATYAVPAVASIVRDVPPALAQVVDRALAFDKADRWPSAQAMHAALAHAGSVVWTSEASAEGGIDRASSMPPCPEQGTLELPTLPGPSGAARVPWRGAPERARSGFPLLEALLCGVGITVAVAVVARASLVPKQQSERAVPRMQTASEQSGSELSKASLPGVPLEASSVSSAEPLPLKPRAVDVETLPQARSALFRDPRGAPSLPRQRLEPPP